MVLFAEGTTGDGVRVLPFRSALLGAARTVVSADASKGERASVWLQPVSIAYTGRGGLPAGRTDQAAHLLVWRHDAAASPQGHLHRGCAGRDDQLRKRAQLDPLVDRKQIAAEIEAEVRSLTVRRAQQPGADGCTTFCDAVSGRCCFPTGKNPVRHSTMDRAHWTSMPAGSAAAAAPDPASSAGRDAGAVVGPRTRRVHIKSYGCQMNAYDAGRMADLLGGVGYAETDCNGRGPISSSSTPATSAKRPSRRSTPSSGGSARSSRDRAARGLGTLVAVAGCVAQAEGHDLKHRKVVDLVVGPQSYHRLPGLLADTAARPVETEFEAEAKYRALSLPEPQRIIARGVSAFVTVQEGCDKFCTFCVVPYTRGAEVSRPVDRILEEVRHLVRNGVRDVTLLGQNVNAYRGSGPDGRPWGLASLLKALAEFDGLARLRYTTSHPNDVDEALIDAHRDLPQLMPSLHLPVQSGSDRILRAMNRKHDADAYRRIVERVRRARPDIALSSDFIVGFPGETDADFDATTRLIRETRFAAAYSFRYSARPGTPAASRAGTVPDAVADARLREIQALIRDQQTQFNAACVGRTVDVLVEKPGREAGQVGGRSPYMQAVHFQGSPALIGKVVPVTVIGLTSNSLAGRIPAGCILEDGMADTITGLPVTDRDRTSMESTI